MSHTLFSLNKLEFNSIPSKSIEFSSGKKQRACRFVTFHHEAFCESVLWGKKHAKFTSWSSHLRVLLHFVATSVAQNDWHNFSRRSVNSLMEYMRYWTWITFIKVFFIQFSSKQDNALTLQIFSTSFNVHDAHISS